MWPPPTITTSHFNGEKYIVWELKGGLSQLPSFENGKRHIVIEMARDRFKQFHSNPFIGNFGKHGTKCGGIPAVSYNNVYTGSVIEIQVTPHPT